MLQRYRSYYNTLVTKYTHQGCQGHLPQSIAHLVVVVLGKPTVVPVKQAWGYAQWQSAAFITRSTQRSVILNNDNKCHCLI